MMQKIQEFLMLFAYQIALSIGLIIVLGLLISLINRLFYKIVGSRYAYRTAIISGFLGTPVHELGHALFCLLFLHKITKIKLFDPNATDGALGYVAHTYNPKNVYHQVGNFFIGIGPIILGSIVLLGLMFLLIPAQLSGIFGLYETFEATSISLSTLASFIKDMFLTIFSTEGFTNILWWVFIILSLSIALHMRISVPDIKHCKVGLVYILIVILVVDIALALFGLLVPFSFGFIVFGAMIMNFMLISLIMSVILLTCAALIRLILTLFSALRGKR